MDGQQMGSKSGSLDGFFSAPQLWRATGRRYVSDLHAPAHLYTPEPPPPPSQQALQFKALQALALGLDLAPFIAPPSARQVPTHAVPGSHHAARAAGGGGGARHSQQHHPQHNSSQHLPQSHHHHAVLHPPTAAGSGPTHPPHLSAQAPQLPLAPLPPPPQPPLRASAAVAALPYTPPPHPAASTPGHPSSSKRAFAASLPESSTVGATAEAEEAEHAPHLHCLVDAPKRRRTHGSKRARSSSHISTQASLLLGVEQQQQQQQPAMPAGREEDLAAATDAAAAASSASPSPSPLPLPPLPPPPAAAAPRPPPVPPHPLPAFPHPPQPPPPALASSRFAIPSTAASHGAVQPLAPPAPPLPPPAHAQQQQQRPAHAGPTASQQDAVQECKQQDWKGSDAPSAGAVPVATRVGAYNPPMAAHLTQLGCMCIQGTGEKAALKPQAELLCEHIISHTSPRSSTSSQHAYSPVREAGALGGSEELLSVREEEEEAEEEEGQQRASKGPPSLAPSLRGPHKQLSLHAECKGGSVSVHANTMGGHVVC